MEFVRTARGGRFNYSTAGVGTTEHLTAEFIFRSVPGVEATQREFAAYLTAEVAKWAEVVNKIGIKPQ